MVKRLLRLFVSALLLCAFLFAPGSLVAKQDAGPPPPTKTTTGPYPPAAVIEGDALRAAQAEIAPGMQIVLPAPNYHWRHGCGPTAVGMVTGYWDMRGYLDLIPGDARRQTDAVNQAIASGGPGNASPPAGQEQHYEDYSVPLDYYPNPVLTDAVITAGRAPHVDNSIADFMRTSRSSEDLNYGHSWTSEIGPAWVQYVNWKNPRYGPSYGEYYWDYEPMLTWELMTRELDAGRPMVFVVDTDADGGGDHAVTVVGYRESPRQYACWDTWYSSLRWENFAGAGPGVRWGIRSAVTLTLDEPPPPVRPQSCLPYVNRGMK